MSCNLQEFPESSKFPWASLFPPKEKASLNKQPQSSVAGRAALMGPGGEGCEADPVFEDQDVRMAEDF